MNKWFRDVIFIPTLVTVSASLLFMVWGAWYTGVKLHSPFSRQWIVLVFKAPVPTWTVVLIVGVCSCITFREHRKKQNLESRVKTSLDLKRSWDSDARQHDQLLFTRSDKIMPESLLMQVVQRLQSDDSYIRVQMYRIRSFDSLFGEVGNTYIDHSISEKLGVLTTTINDLLSFVARHFFVYPEVQERGDQVQFCLYPNLNVDRDGDGAPEAMTKYDLLGEQLSSIANRVRDAYSDYRSAVKSYLYI